MWAFLHGHLPYWHRLHVIFSLSSFLYSCCTMTGAAMLLWTSFCMPLTLKSHLWLQSILCFVFIWMRPQVTCGYAFLASSKEQPFGVSAPISAPRGYIGDPQCSVPNPLAVEYMSTVWYHVLKIARFLPDHDTMVEDPMVLCTNVVTLVLLLLAWLLPTVVIYWHERYSRHHYLEVVEGHPQYLHFLHVREAWREQHRTLFYFGGVWAVVAHVAGLALLLMGALVFCLIMVPLLPTAADMGIVIEG